MKTRFVDFDTLSLYTENFGSPEDPAVLLIMGAMASGVWWPEEFCEMLAGRGRFVIRYDHRDTGKSTSYAPGKPEYTIEDLADDAIRVLDGYGIASAHFVGMSLGGYLAQLCALKFVERVMSLTLIASQRLASPDPTMPGVDPRVLEYHHRAAELDWSDRDAVVDYQVGAWQLLAGSAHPFDAALIRAMAVAEYDRTPNPLTPFNHAQIENADAWLDRLAEILQPALIIHGTEDLVFPYVHAEALHAELPNARLLALEGTGHELPRADWPVIVEAIARHTATR